LTPDRLVKPDLALRSGVTRTATTANPPPSSPAGILPADTVRGTARGTAPKNLTRERNSPANPRQNRHFHRNRHFRPTAGCEIGGKK